MPKRMFHVLQSLTPKSRSPRFAGARLANCEVARRSQRARAMPASPPVLRGCGAFAFLFALGVSSGCSVTALSERESPFASNECESNDHCSGGQCSGGMCVAVATELSSLLFEVTPSTNAGLIGGASFLSPHPRFTSVGGVVELELEALDVTGSLTPAGRRDCTPFFTGARDEILGAAADGSIPARVTFTPAVRPDGPALPGRITSAETVPTPSVGNPLVPSSHEFDLELPSGTYDVLVEPWELAFESSAGCSFPPQLIRGLCLEERTDLQLSVPVPARLQLTVASEPNYLEGWVADVLDEASGRSISRAVPFRNPATGGGTSKYSVQLDYLRVVEHEACVLRADEDRTELIRLSPPADLLAPVMLFERTALELFSPGQGHIGELPALPAPVTLEGHVFSGTNLGEAASLTFVAQELKGVPGGVMAAFTRRTETRKDGGFQVELLPGTYEVTVVPTAAALGGELGLAATRATWEVGVTPSLQAGRAIELRRAVSIRGSAFGPGETRPGARGANVVAEASRRATAENVLVRALRGEAAAPRATSMVITEADGQFAISADFGVFDFSVRPPEGSGFAWLVMPNLDLSFSGETRSLSEVQLPLPVEVDLRARLVGDANAKRLEGARVRVHASIDMNGEPTAAGVETSLIVVAEGRLDGSGRARLLVPASLQSARSE